LPQINFIENKNIDKQKWDFCVDNALHTSVFCTSKYLDCIANRWHALILNDYEVVMPIISRKKLGISYLYQPAFLPQVGIFSTTKIKQDMIKAFLLKAFGLYIFAEISFIHPFHIESFDKNLIVKTKNNFIVDLQKDYEEIANNYHPHFTKSLRRLQKLNLIYSISEDVKEIIKLYELLYLEKIKSVLKKDVADFTKLCIEMQKEGNLVIRKVLNQKGNLLAAAILPKHKYNLYNIISCITPEGKKAEANYFLYDKIMKEFSGSNYLLDLEGSDIKGIANFYLKMNPVNKFYFSLKYNNLPKFIKLIKK
jgi:hypothetical protein